MGKWVGADGVIYDRFERAVHVREFPDCQEWGRYILSVDEGTSHPFSVGRWWVDSDGRMHRDAEFYRRGLLTKSKVQACKSLCVPHLMPEAVVVDSAALGLCNDLRDAGLPVVAADKRSVSDGIDRVYDRFATDLDGRARITVSSRCEAWLEEVQSYSWRKNQDGSYAEVPKKEHDDAMDETRYAATYLGSPGVQVW